MRAKVTRLREHGRRLPLPGEGVPGMLGMAVTVAGSTSHCTATLTATAERGSMSVNLIPALFEPQLVAIGSGTLMLRGFESNDGAAYVQEWAVDLQTQ